jgi:uncharacterized membrane protein
MFLYGFFAKQIFFPVPGTGANVLEIVDKIGYCGRESCFGRLRKDERDCLSGMGALK